MNTSHPRTWDTLDLVRALKRAEKKLLYHKHCEHEIETLCAWLEEELERRAERAALLHGILYVNKTQTGDSALACGD